MCDNKAFVCNKEIKENKTKQEKNCGDRKGTGIR